MTRQGREPTTYRVRGGHTNHSTNPTRLNQLEIMHILVHIHILCHCTTQWIYVANLKWIWWELHRELDLIRKFNREGTMPLRRWRHLRWAGHSNNSSFRWAKKWFFRLCLTYFWVCETSPSLICWEASSVAPQCVRLLSWLACDCSSLRDVCDMNAFRSSSVMASSALGEECILATRLFRRCSFSLAYFYFLIR